MAYEMSMVEEFMTNWQSQAFRERIVAQISGAKENSHPDPHSSDQMEQFLAQNTSQQLEQFIFDKSQQREDYLSLVADLILHIRRCKGPPGQGRENLNGGSPKGEDQST